MNANAIRNKGKHHNPSQNAYPIVVVHLKVEKNDRSVKKNIAKQYQTK